VSDINRPHYLAELFVEISIKTCGLDEGSCACELQKPSGRDGDGMGIHFTIKGKRSKGVKRQRKESDIQVETGVLFLFSVFFF
jgi:hypothetical protein